MYFICYYVYLWWSVLFLHIFYEVFSQCWYHFISFFNSFNTAFRLIKPPLEITDIILLHVRHLQGLRYAQCVCLCVQVDYNFNHEPVSLYWCWRVSVFTWIHIRIQTMFEQCKRTKHSIRSQMLSQHGYKKHTEVPTCPCYVILIYDLIPYGVVIKQNILSHEM